MKHHLTQTERTQVLLAATKGILLGLAAVAVLAAGVQLLRLLFSAIVA